jgi:hypothetical protein
VVVVGLDEDVADENAGENGSEGELEISEIAESETLTGRTEKCARAGFRRDDGSEHRPPGNTPATEGKVLEIVFLPPM